ncbi:MAG: TspO/MBR family protein [Candidatus Pacearchaeota archaeon]
MDNKKKINKIFIFFFILFIVFSVAFIGSVFTSSSVKTEWYESIKPGITPPNFIFVIVWNILFFLISLSIYFSWISSNKNEKKIILIVYGINFFLNILWTFIYFVLKNPLLSFFEIIFLFFSIIILIKVSYKINKVSSYLLIPYFLWIIFASYLNFLSIK